MILSQLPYELLSLWPKICFLQLQWPLMLTLKFKSVNPFVQVNFLGNSRTFPQSISKIYLALLNVYFTLEQNLENEHHAVLSKILKVEIDTLYWGYAASEQKKYWFKVLVCQLQLPEILQRKTESGLREKIDKKENKKTQYFLWKWNVTSAFISNKNVSFNRSYVKAVGLFDSDEAIKLHYHISVTKIVILTHKTEVVFSFCCLNLWAWVP